MLHLSDRGRLAQLGERIVRNDEAGGSNPLPSTNSFNNLLRFSELHELLAVLCFEVREDPSTFRLLDNLKGAEVAGNVFVDFEPQCFANTQRTAAGQECMSGQPLCLAS
jgi:hypothetical protein